jgi:hypothetical protein
MLGIFQKIAGVFFIVVGVWTIVSYFNKSDIRNLVENGVKAQAELIGEVTEEEHLVRGGEVIADSGFLVYRYRGNYTFLTQSGEKVFVSLSTLDRNLMQKGKPLTVVYLPTDPRGTALIAGDENNLAISALAIGLLMSFFGLHIMFPQSNS